MLEFARRGLADLGAALKLRGVWWALASEDVADSHRQTMLGPIWPLLNYLLFVGTLVLVLGNRAGSPNFVAYVATGMLVWLFISDVLSMSATLFAREENFIKGTVLPLSIYVMRQTLVISIRSFYALLGAVAVLLYSGFAVTPALLSVVPAVLLLLAAAPAVAVLFGIAGAYFRDFQFIVVNATRLLMFVTPIFWTDPGAGGLLGFLYYWNPLTHYIDIIRMPIVDGMVPLESWTAALSITAVLLAGALVALGKFNRQIVFQL
ncbi:ABC transporter permease [Mesorhizobium sp. KR9-304]|uniref:ABC transporter permease n=1 Tax=Mesorhizobium sp. KR9-304 TaxID=3156614 RepID=UPI0032B3A631